MLRVEELPIAGWEWIVVIIVVLVFLLWGPQKIPQLARALGQARKEFDKASKEGEQLASEIVRPPRPAQPSPVPSEDQTLIEIAKKLGIETEGKTRNQILNEVLQTLSKTLGGKSASAA